MNPSTAPIEDHFSIRNFSYQGVLRKFKEFSHNSAAIMVLLPYKQASQPSPKLIIVASGINANHEGHEILLIHHVVI